MAGVSDGRRAARNWLIASAAKRSQTVHRRRRSGLLRCARNDDVERARPAQCTLVSRTRCSVNVAAQSRHRGGHSARQEMGPGSVARHAQCCAASGAREQLAVGGTAYPDAPNPLRRRVIIQSRHRVRSPRQHRALVDVALVGDLAAIDRRRLGEKQRARGVAGGIGALLLSFARPCAMAVLTLSCASTSFASAVSGRPACARQAAMFGNTRNRTSSPPWPVTTMSCASGASAAMPATRSVPTLTQVPELSLKSSATRPSKNRPRSGRPGLQVSRRRR